jgi:hypothetical protein
MSEIDLLEENIKLREKVNELTFELERTEFELRDARRALSKYQDPKETEITVAPLAQWPHNDKTQVWGHQDS